MDSQGTTPEVLPAMGIGAIVVGDDLVLIERYRVRAASGAGCCSAGTGQPNCREDAADGALLLALASRRRRREQARRCPRNNTRPPRAPFPALVGGRRRSVSAASLKVWTEPSCGRSVAVLFDGERTGIWSAGVEGGGSVVPPSDSNPSGTEAEQIPVLSPPAKS